MNLRPFEPIQTFGLTLTQSTATTSPVTVDQFVQYAKLDTPDQPERDLIESILTACTYWAERYTGRPMAVRGFVAEYEVGGVQIELPRIPVVAISEVRVNDIVTTDFEQSGADGRFVALDEPGYRTKITFTAGTATINPNDRLGLLRMALSAYENREDFITGGIQLSITARTFFGADKMIVI
jgi:hypothetical protein